MKQALILIGILFYTLSFSALANAEGVNTEGWYLYNNHSGSHSYSLLFPRDWKVKTFGPNERGFMPARQREEVPLLKVKDFEGLSFNEVITHYKTPEVSFFEQYDFVFEMEDEDLIAKKTHFANRETGDIKEKIMIKRGGQIIVISRNEGEEDKMVDAIINSFKFTDNWEAQINFREGYTFIIPKNYSVERADGKLEVLNLAGNKVLKIEDNEVSDIGRTYVTGQIMKSFHHFDIPESGVYSYEYFLDVRDDHPAAKAINTLTKKGVVGGYNDGTFRPNDPVSRAEAVKMATSPIVRRVLSPIIFRDCFEDVEDQWFARYVCYSKAMGRIDGYEDGTFRPGQMVRGEEGMKIILKLSGMEELPEGVPEIDSERMSRKEFAQAIFKIKY